MFSKTLVLLAGIGIIAIQVPLQTPFGSWTAQFTFPQVASRYGIDVVEQLKLKKRIESSRILSALKNKPVFKLSFGLTLFLSAFMSF